MAQYKLSNNGVIDTTTGAHIPNNPANRHWQEYQEWLAVPNVPDPADTPDWDSEGRGLRNGKLADTDWTQTDDFPGDAQKKSDFATYRQDLRDLPADYPDYSTVVWPTEPTYP